MIKILSKFILNKVIGWKVIGFLPLNRSYIIAVVPHSSYFDLIIAVLIRTYSGLKIKHKPLLQNLLPDSLGPSLKTCP